MNGERNASRVNNKQVDGRSYPEHFIKVWYDRVNQIMEFVKVKNFYERTRKRFLQYGLSKNSGTRQIYMAFHSFFHTHAEKWYTFYICTNIVYFGQIFFVLIFLITFWSWFLYNVLQD